MTDLDLILGLLAVVSAVVAFMSYWRAKESNEIAIKAINEQLRPQIVVCFEQVNHGFTFLYIKNIGNAPAMNLRTNFPKGDDENIELTSEIDLPAILSRGERKLLRLYSKYEDGSKTGDLSHKLNKRRIVVLYDDVSTNNHYKTTFEIDGSKTKYISTTVSSKK